MSYDSWLTHNPADDGDWKEVDVVVTCHHEHPVNPADPDAVDWVRCDFNDTIETEVWIGNSSWIEFEWKCPTCGMLNDEGRNLNDILGIDDE